MKSQTKGYSYHAVILNPNSVNSGFDIVLSNTNIKVQFVILDSSDNIIYREQQSVKTDFDGMIHLLIGSGTPLDNYKFSDIIWDGTQKKLKVEVDFYENNNFTTLSEQNFLYTPKPENSNTKYLISQNKVKILNEKNRAIAGEKINTDDILILTDEQESQNSAILLNTLKISYPGDQDISEISKNATILSTFKFYYADNDEDGFGDKWNLAYLPELISGYVADNTDCNDTDASIYPGATEIPDDGIDQNCDGFDLKTWYADTDADTFGNPTNSTTANSQPENFVADNTDCNDTDASIYPGATEIADDGIDQDCDGADLKTWYKDADADGFGDLVTTTTSNTQPTNYVNNNTDCDDTEASIYPGATEITDDGIDQDCDGADLKTWYADTDADGFGDLVTTTTSNTQPTNYVNNNTDCDDAEASIYPGATEIADDGIDQDCDGADLKTWYKDADWDTFGDASNSKTANKQPFSYVIDNTDCDDGAASIYYGATEIVDDGIDQDCDGFDLKIWYKDTDGDTFGDISITITANSQPINFVSNSSDCNDNAANIYPGATEIPNDGIDQDCDGLVLQTWYADADVDTFGDTNTSITANTQPANYVSNNTDCDDTDDAIYPGAIEISDDGIDQDCDGADLKTWYKDADGDTFGDASNTTTSNTQPDNFVSSNTDCNDGDATIYPGATEIDNDGIDQDCNLATDSSRTWYIDNDGDNYGDSNTSIIALTKPVGYVDNNLDCNDSDVIYDPFPPLGGGQSPWAYKFGSRIYPGATEIGNDGIDQNCNGSDAINWYPDNDGDGYGNESILPIVSDVQPEGYVRGDGVGFGDCNDNDPTVYFFSGNDIPDDGIDQDCDGYDLRTWYKDTDGDGFGDSDQKFLHNLQNANYVLKNNDCDDTQITGATIYPGADEIIDDGIDQDCDGFDLRTWYEDKDVDGYGNNNVKIIATSKPIGYVSNNADCNDTLLDGSNFNPDITEIVDDGIDQDCDGFDLRTWYEDKDEDGYGNSNTSIIKSRKPEGYVINNTDCNDTSASIHPGASEIPGDGIDQDCDDYDLRTWYQDLDNDFFGNPNIIMTANAKPDGYIDNNQDCNDTLLDGASFNPNKSEIVNDGLDQDCDGFDLQFWYIDLDEDGYGNKDDYLFANTKPDGNYVLDNTDCNDDDKNINPEAKDIPNDGVDSNCDGYDVKRWYIDLDEDGYGYFGEDSIIIYSNEKPDGYVDNALDCNDTTLNGALFNPDIAEIPNDGIDQNCDNADLKTWYTDADGDGFGDPNIPSILASFREDQTSGYSINNFDCDDTPIKGASIYPGATEILDDGIDQNCDKFDLQNWYADADKDTYGNPNYNIKANEKQEGFVKDNRDCDDDPISGVTVYPGAPEILDDGIDQNCDKFDLKTWYLDEDGDKFGNPDYNTQANEKPDGFVAKNTDCDDDPITGPTVYPGAAEIANDGIDQDCDGIGPIITWYRDADNDSYGDLNATVLAETKPDGYILNNEDCQDHSTLGINVYPGAIEVLDDGIDQNCDGFDLITWYQDLDEDGFGTENATLIANSNEQPLGYSNKNTDCNDTIGIGATIYPGAPEIANDHIDQDCDGKDLIIWYYDGDRDGFGNPDVNLIWKRDRDPSYYGQGSRYVKNNTDCDDSVEN
tara:strand:- start:2071 stop:6963 length:4893 start_codon:yes stop_codon:yes gene_type:complete